MKARSDAKAGTPYNREAWSRQSILEGSGPVVFPA